MILSEEQARTKWCPFARVGNEAGCNRNGTEFRASPHCIASECMVWRACESRFHFGKDRFLVAGESYSSTDKTESRPNGRGFCGLAERDL